MARGMNVLKNKEGMEQQDQVPKYPRELPGSFWGITTFYNPTKSKNRLKNYYKFRKVSKNQGLNLLCVELVFGDSKFELKKGDAEILVQIRTDTLLWQKERLINLGLKNLPGDCDKFAWLDSDIIFQDDGWIDEACKLLGSYVVVQLFSSVVLLPRSYRLRNNKIFIKKDRTESSYGAVYKTVSSSKGKPDISKMGPFSPGFAWAARRKSFEKVQLYDGLIMGGGDRFMAHGFYGNKNFVLKSAFNNPQMIEHQIDWINNIYWEIKGSVYYREGLIFHLWHGKMENRFYWLRRNVLRKYGFEPKRDIRISRNGCWEWATNKGELHKSIRRYFWMRNEDGSFLKECILFFHRFRESLFKKSLEQHH